MLTPTSNAAPGIKWGLGWGIQQSDGPDTYWHWGNNGSRYLSFVVWERQSGNGIVIMTNSGNGNQLYRDLVLETMKGQHPAFNWQRVIPQN